MQAVAAIWTPFHRLSPPCPARSQETDARSCTAPPQRRKFVPATLCGTLKQRDAAPVAPFPTLHATFRAGTPPRSSRLFCSATTNRLGQSIRPRRITRHELDENIGKSGHRVAWPIWANAMMNKNKSTSGRASSGRRLGRSAWRLTGGTTVGPERRRLTRYRLGGLMGGSSGATRRRSRRIV